MFRFVRSESLVQTILSSFFPRLNIEPQAKTVDPEKGTHRVDFLLRLLTGNIAVEVATLYKRSKAFQPDEAIEQLERIINDPRNKVAYGLLVLDGNGFTGEDIRRLKALARQRNIRLVQSLSHLEELCQAGELSMIPA